MPNTYTLIQKITVAASTSSVTFTNIPQTYTDLIIYQSAMSDVTTALAGNYNIEFNGVTTGYSGRRFYSDPSGGTASDTGTSKWAGFIPGSGALQNTPNSSIIYIPNYTSSNSKSWHIDTVVENNATNGYLGMGGSIWTNSAAITSFTLSGISSSIYTGNFLRNSTFYLYGVTKLGVIPTSAPKATGGDAITTDGTYWYHQFLTSGTFTPKSSLSCDYLVVAGGGGSGGGSSWNAGGGAGGLRCTVTATGGGGSLESTLSLIANTGYTVTVGAGGAAGVNGSNSVFSTITSTGGGRGGANATGANATGALGGSGGGGSANNYAGGAGTSSQGYAGGTGSGSNNGGGGGAGGTGGNASGATAGAAGAGVATVISGTSITYAAGGAGGNTATAGATNTGNGATGGTGNPSGSAAGGSGIVIVRYPV